MFTKRRSIKQFKGMVSVMQKFDHYGLGDLGCGISGPPENADNLCNCNSLQLFFRGAHQAHGWQVGCFMNGAE
jgi:hypothetical protein